ncbi:hypothetical protein, partial [Bradyrhizobium japonicum]|uniref:hypothetical protein n=1 Tax=Bradyrhizobium japonicum TaxID=375 RepID=UPI001AEC3685
VLDAYTLQARCVGRPHQVRGSVGLSYRLRLTNHQGPGTNQNHGDNNAADTDVASLHGSNLGGNDDTIA